MKDTPQLLLFADVLPNGSGGFTVRPRKPLQEIGTTEAAHMLGVCRSTMWELRNDATAGKYLKWRFTTPSQRKVLFELDSVVAYLEYTRSLEGADFPPRKAPRSLSRS